MKNWIYGLLLLGAGASITACEGFLDKSPLGVETDQNFFNDPTNAVLAVNSVYDVAAWDEGNGAPHNYEFMFGDILSDDAAKGSTPNDFIDLVEMEQWRTTATNGPVTGVWHNMHIGLFRANTVIKNLPEADLPEELKNRLMGEAKFLRGYFSFYLARIFGGIIIMNEPVKPSEFGNLQRSSLAESYAFIAQDFAEAAALLPAKGDYAAEDLGRATQGAAWAYQARVHMFEAGLGMNGTTWQQVYDLTAKIVASGEYQLLANYAELFEVEGENSIESIFEVQTYETTETWGPIKTGTTGNIFQNNRSTWGWGFNNPTQDLVDAYESGDPRMPCTVYKDGDIVLGEAQVIEYPEANQTGYLNRKAAIESPSTAKAAGQNIRKFRYADLLLMHAEAAYHLGNEAEAIMYVNMVRERALNATKPKGSTEGSMDYASYGAGELDGVLEPLSGISGQDLLDAIYQERRVELGMESIRYWDLVRTGRYMDMLPEADRAMAMSHSLTEGLTHPYPVLPIPVSEVESWGIAQNPNY
ncbi:RagB/SusD family nutrient uptake outer membrane protein [Pontibacter sp. G13]|uniref:RagB/SusD family nutrient uptake outer membrane protein n=1 Tax=Pontibacter sp. G13 TaxID=3074898 RepID=UPI00288B338C|nr:RagB/SusD family nutrient uptake outer membrane protein [Pontibacter sp. G13]WNJ21068.1 RagB/SusD family nutrient uptake outer membrane protein [Pontibacter sp. G13]